ncbi:hypothetical protein BAJUN_00780 [Bajunvirus bajun]|uniref:Uncharacterized protein n=1 Tax=Brevundimonas phage vB_BgoS-Bajun TaxID=2948594 RepID=A0A9E7N4G4_9CAUD|nr:hypothetical protein BAJUN_00780 [Brevundimonas phage vB_BgoS-Bajun]
MLKKMPDDLPREISALLRLPESDNPQNRATAANITIPELPAYFGKLKTLGFLDANQRITRLGAIYRVVAEFGAEQGATFKHIAREVGGDRESLDANLAKLVEMGLIQAGEVSTKPFIAPQTQEAWDEAERKHGIKPPEVGPTPAEPGYIALAFELPEA